MDKAKSDAFAYHIFYAILKNPQYNILYFILYNHFSESVEVLIKSNSL